MTAPLRTTKAKLASYPPRTAIEVYELLPESTRSEVIDNTLYMPPTPSFEHQDMSLSLSVSIYLFITRNGSGKCVTAPISVYLDENNVVEPDIVFIKTERLHLVQNGKIKGIPDLLIELLSPGNRNHDLKRKFELYQRFGIPEYIIVDPLTKVVRQYVLNEHTYQQLPSEKGRFYSHILQSSFSF